MKIGWDVEFGPETCARGYIDLLTPKSAADDGAGFAPFVERHLRFVFQVAYAVLRNAANAEDIAQEVFFKLLRGRGWRGMQDEKAYLARMTWRLCLQRGPVPRTVDAEQCELESTLLDPESAAIARQRQARIHKLIDALPEDLRRPLALSAIEEMTTPRIAEAMSLPEGTVRRRIAEARALLKQKLLRMEDGFR